MAEKTDSVPPDDPGAKAISNLAAAAPAEFKEWQKIFGEKTGTVATTEKVKAASAADDLATSAQERELRPWIAFVVIATLWSELVAIFFLLLWQGRGGHFKLNDWLIGTIANGVIIQTLWCLKAIATHLYWKGADKTPK